MKNIKRLLVLVGVMLLVLLSAGCSEDALPTPGDLKINGEHVLSWSKVEKTKTYVIEVTQIGGEGQVREYTSRKESYSLKALPEGAYSIRVRAKSGVEEFVDSAWSETLHFDRPYETGCTYTLINNATEYAISGGGRVTGTIVIEDVYKGKPVTRIDEGAFKNNNKLTGIVLGANIREIGAEAFRACSSLASITIPETVTSIGEKAFYACSSLTEIKLPAGLTELSVQMFAQCTSLASVNIGDQITSIGERAFMSCAALAELVIPDSVTYIGSGAFSDMALLKKVVIGAGVTHIDSEAFWKCASLETVEFAEGSSLERIGSQAFAECGALASITLPDGLLYLERETFYLSEKLSEVNIPSTVVEVGPYVIHGTKLHADAIEQKAGMVFVGDWLVALTSEYKASVVSIKRDEFPEGVRGIAGMVFVETPLLRDITLPKTLEYVGDYAFAKCPELYKVVMSNTAVKELGDYAFAYSPMLNSISMSNTLENIGNWCFLSGGVSSIILPDSLRSIGTQAFCYTPLWYDETDHSTDEDENDAYTFGVIYADNWVIGFNKEFFFNDEANQILDYPAEIKLKTDTAGISTYAFYQLDFIKKIDGVDNATYLNKGAFYECSSMTRVNLNMNLQRIEEETFYGCRSLYTINFPPMLSYIGDLAFYQCEMLAEVDLSKSQVSYLGEYAFYGCKSLGNGRNLNYVDLGTYLTEISRYAFYGCEGLPNVVIPDSVTHIGERAYARCTRLETIRFGSSLVNIGDHAFRNCEYLTELSFPETLTSIGRYAFYGCLKLQALNFGDGIETLGDYSFFGAEVLREVHLPKGVKTIGKYAFKGCKYLASITIPSTVEFVGANAFYDCKRATVYTDLTEAPAAWAARWNSSYRPVVWGCTLSEDRDYVVSVSVGEKTFENLNRYKQLTSATREGYVFLGWSTDPAATSAEYSAELLSGVPVGTTVYSVWKERVPEEPETPDAPDTPDTPDTPESETPSPDTPEAGA